MRACVLLCRFTPMLCDFWGSVCRIGVVILLLIGPEVLKKLELNISRIVNKSSFPKILSCDTLPLIICDIVAM